MTKKPPADLQRALARVKHEIRRLYSGVVTERLYAPRPDLPAVSEALRMHRLTGIPPQSLRVFYNVPSADLIPPGGVRPEAASVLADRLYTVVCEGPRVRLVSVHPEEGMPKFDGESVPGLLIMRHGGIRGGYREIIDGWTAKIPPELFWQYRPSVLPPRYIKPFCHRRLLRKISTPQVPAAYLPTRDGWKAGLSLGCYMRETGAVFCAPICSPDCLERLLLLPECGKECESEVQ